MWSLVQPYSEKKGFHYHELSQQIFCKPLDPTAVALVGGAALDNSADIGDSFYESTVSEALEARLEGSEGAVLNAACDGFRSADVLNGSSEELVSKNWRERRGDPFPPMKEGRFEPLQRLCEYEPLPTHVVVAVLGADDVREVRPDHEWEHHAAHLRTTTTRPLKEATRPIRSLRTRSPFSIIALRLPRTLLSWSPAFGQG